MAPVKSYLASEFARMYGLSPHKLYRAIDRGDLNSFRRGHYIFVKMTPANDIMARALVQDGRTIDARVRRYCG